MRIENVIVIEVKLEYKENLLFLCFIISIIELKCRQKTVNIFFKVINFGQVESLSSQN
jgi:hypothetical protein